MAGGLGGLIGKFGDVQKGMDSMMLFADLLNQTQKRIKRVMQEQGMKCTDKLAEALAKDRLDWMMTDMAAVAEQMEGLGGEEVG